MGVRPARWVGSSPQMRGALKACALYISHNRIIPADAGSTVLRSPCQFLNQDHPRRCGEHYRIGIIARRDSQSKRSGIIPADAGSTPPPGYSRAARTDHPRRCGEHGPRPGSTDHRSGSSPQMRGARSCFSAVSTQLGIIPADAGSTNVGDGSHARFRDHPRRCGEHLVLCCWTAQGRGSSPQMRGAHDSRHSEPDRRGIIPADAGSTMPRRFCTTAQ